MNDNKPMTAEEEPFDSNIYSPPFRVGRKQNKAVLDKNGLLVILMPNNNVNQAKAYCDYLNGQSSLLSEIERLKKEVEELTTCECGCKISRGTCIICDNDD